uniref:Uncharacterized protein n=1 Tax=Glossina brevipalpis TaxID=37001 RepID=A0A1A9WMG2_9MUSC
MPKNLDKKTRSKAAHAFLADCIAHPFKNYQHIALATHHLQILLFLWFVMSLAVAFLWTVLYCQSEILQFLETNGNISCRLRLVHLPKGVKDANVIANMSKTVAKTEM